MKTKIVLALSFISIAMYAQDTIPIRNHSLMFSVSPMSKKTGKVNGLALGFGHVENKNIPFQTINGANIEANPAPAVGVLMTFMAVIYLPEIIKNNARSRDTIIKKEPDLKIKNWNYAPKLKINGINLSTGCFFTTTSMNGLNISFGNKFTDFNGLSIAPLGTISDQQNGMSVGITNTNNCLTGAAIGVYNQSVLLQGLQIGVFNQVETNKGVQIGIFNKSRNRGFQLGVWNKNKKRSFPILNW